MGVLQSYRLRVRRRRFLARALRKRRELTVIKNRTKHIRKGEILLFATVRNELPRLPHFLDYYRKLGVSQFLIVDNGSDDGTARFLGDQPDVSIWSTVNSYRTARYGVDWLNWLLMRYGHGHWCLTVDVDELFVYPFCDTRPIRALTDWLDTSGVRSFSAMMLDMYPKGPIDSHPYRIGQDPLEILQWFDSGNYMISRNPEYNNLWIQGGPRARTFFADAPEEAPSLNKVPLIKWDRRYAYVNSTHMVLPRGLNLVYDDGGGEKPSGILLHTKFLSTFVEKTAEEIERGQHFAGGREYKAYHDKSGAPLDLWCKWSEKYINWRQLEILGLMSKGNWA